MGNIGKGLEINGSGVGGSTGDDQPGTVGFRQIPDPVVIQQAGLVIHIIRNRVVILAGDVGGAAVGQVATVGQAHAHESIAGLQQRQLHRRVGLGAGMGLHIGKFRAEQLLGPVDAKLLQLVHILAAAVVPLAGQAFGIFVGQHAAHGGDHGG